MRHFTTLIAIATVLTSSAALAGGVDPNQLKEALEAQSRASAKARWEIFEAVQEYQDQSEKQRYMAKKGQRPLRPRNLKGTTVASTGPIDDSLFSRFIAGKYEIAKKAAAEKPVNPAIACKAELEKTHGKARRAKRKECRALQAKWDRYLEQRARDMEIERERRERERLRRQREEYRRRLEIRGRSLTY